MFLGMSEEARKERPSGLVNIDKKITTDNMYL